MSIFLTFFILLFHCGKRKCLLNGCTDQVPQNWMDEVPMKWMDGKSAAEIKMPMKLIKFFNTF